MKYYFKIAVLTAVTSACGLTAAESQAQSFLWPAPGCSAVYSEFGNRGSYFHDGIDISCWSDQDIVASADGTVTNRIEEAGHCVYDDDLGACGDDCVNSIGNSLQIQHDGGWMTKYHHLDSFASKAVVGAHFSAGEFIGKMGNTGCSTGQHLHFSIYQGSSAKDPRDYVTYGNPNVDMSENDEYKYQSMNYDPQNTDVDGDGKADICIRASAGLHCTLSAASGLAEIHNILNISDKNGWDGKTHFSTIRFADFNGDGKADVCGRDTNGVKCWPSTGTSFGKQTNTISMSDENGYDNHKYTSTIRFADINGDGKDDFCARYKSGFYCYLSQGDHWPEENDNIFLNDMGDNGGWGKPEYYSTIRMPDINGDGKYDVCARRSSGFQCWISKGTSFEKGFSAIPWSDEAGFNKREYYSTIRMPDINGDGKSDACIRDEKGVVCHLSEGTKFGPAIRGPEFSDAKGWAGYDNYSTIIFGDFSGDGKDDLCIRADDYLSCHVSNGSGFGGAYALKQFSNKNGWNKPDQFRTIRMGDIDGDGKAEICGRFADGLKCYRFNGEGFSEIIGPDLGNKGGWHGLQYYSTLRIGGPALKACRNQKEICDEIDNDCDGQIDEDGVCDKNDECVPEKEICDQKDNDCDGQIDEDGVCDKNDECIPEKEICDQKDNDCDGQIDEDGVCDKNDECIPEKEICDQKDNDCDGQIDEGGVCDKNDEENGEDDIAGSSPDACSGTPIAPAKAPVGTGLLFAGLLAALLLRRKETIRNDKRA